MKLTTLTTASLLLIGSIAIPAPSMGSQLVNLHKGTFVKINDGDQRFTVCGGSYGGICYHYSNEEQDRYPLGDAAINARTTRKLSRGEHEYYSKWWNEMRY